MKRPLTIGMLVMGLAAPAQARWMSSAPPHPGWVSDWSVRCTFERGSIEAATFEAWDDSVKYQRLLRPRPTRPPTWTVTTTPHELAELNLSVRSEKVLGLGRICQVMSNKTGEKLSFDEAWIVFGDIQRKREAAAESREMARRDRIRARLGITQEAATRGQ